MNTLNNILYPGTSIWESDVWGKDIIFESVIPEPEEKLFHHADLNLYEHQHRYPFEHGGHSGSVTITHHGPINPEIPASNEEAENLMGSVDISFKMGEGASGYKSIGKENIPPKIRTAIGAKIKGIVKNHIATRGKDFAKEMKKHGIQAHLSAEAYEPGASFDPEARRLGIIKHHAYENMFKSIAKRLSGLFHPFTKPKKNDYEDITGFHTPNKLYYR